MTRRALNVDARAAGPRIIETPASLRQRFGDLTHRPEPKQQDGPDLWLQIRMRQQLRLLRQEAHSPPATQLTCPLCTQAAPPLPLPRAATAKRPWVASLECRHVQAGSLRRYLAKRSVVPACSAAHLADLHVAQAARAGVASQASQGEHAVDEEEALCRCGACYGGVATK